MARIISSYVAVLAIILSLSSLSRRAAGQMCTDVPTANYLDSTGKYAIPYNTVQGWYKNVTTWYWTFGPRSTAAGPPTDPGSIVLAAPIWVPYYANGTKAGNNIIDVVPCQPEYSDLWMVHKLTVPDSMPLNFYKDAATAKAAIASGTVMEAIPGLLVNCPVVPFNSTIMDTLSPNPNVSASLPNNVFGWYKGQPVSYFDFGPVTSTVTQPVIKVDTQNGNAAGQNIIDEIPGDPGYTPFWQLVLATVPNTLGNNMTRSLQVAYEYPHNFTALVVNCPVSYTTPGANSGLPPPTPATGAISGCSKSFMGQSMDFDNCLMLDTAGAFSLAWRPKGGDASSGVFEVLYTGAPEETDGWAGWAISPSGLMPGSDGIVGYGSATGASGVGVYHMQGLAPTMVPPSSFQSANPPLLLQPVAGSLKVQVADGGATVMTLADVGGLNQGPVIVIWKSGPSADVSTGMLMPHYDLTKNSRSVDFVSGSASGEDTTTPRQSQKIAHAFLAAIGFGVLLPLGILVARHVKLWADPLWYFTHIGLQVLGYTVGVAGWSIGIWLKTQYGDIYASGTPSYQQAHYGIGVAIFCTSTLQILSPTLKPHKELPVRLYWNLAHWGLGYSTVILAIVNIFLGFSIMANENINYGGWRTAYIVIIAVWGGLMVLLEPISWYKYLEAQKVKGASDPKHAETTPLEGKATDDPEKAVV